MIISLKDILKTEGVAVGAFNTPNLECLIAVLGAAEQLQVPVIVMHAEVHEEVSPLSVIGPIMVAMAERASIPVCVHLDHCEHLNYMEQALDLGFSGVMYDGSLLDTRANTENTQKAVELAAAYGAGVEAEVGSLAAREGGSDAKGPVYTDPEAAVRFCRETGIDALAPSFGTSHGLYKSKPVLDFERLAVISRETGLPLVMHGGSGVSPEDYKTGIRCGLRKINYYTYMSHAGTRAAQALLRDMDVTYYHDIALTAQKAMQADVLQALHIFTER